MYSYYDRLRAVQLYIKLGKRVGLTIRQLGFPTKNALKAWHRAHEQRHGLPEGYVRDPKYTQWVLWVLPPVGAHLSVF